MILPHENISSQSWNLEMHQYENPLAGVNKHYLEARLKDAIQLNEICYYVQPIFDISSQKLIAAEALLRWERDFDIYLPLEHYLERFKSLETATPFFEIMADKRKNLRNLIEHNCDLDLHFNLNSKFLQYPQSVYGISNLCGENPCLFENTVIEVTEEILSHSKEQELSQFIDEAKKAGCKIALDDFGSEHSNLNRLMNYEIDIIKLDKSLTNQLTKKLKAKAVLRNLAAMCNDLGIKVYAEGVECQRTAEALVEIGISIHQGRLYGMPISAKDFALTFDKYKDDFWVNF